jgi:hypothetical protein
VPHETVPHRIAENTAHPEPREEKGGHEPGKENETAKGHEPVSGHEPTKGGHEAASEHNAVNKEHEPADVARHGAAPGKEATATKEHEALPPKEATATKEHEATPAKEPSNEHEALPPKAAPKEHEPTTGHESTTDAPKKVEMEKATHSAPTGTPARPPPTPRKVTAADKKE